MKPPLLPSLLALAVLALPLVGQNQIYVPDNMPAVGTCNAFPFNYAAFTYVSRIPASFMDPSNTYVDDVWFAPCGSGTWSAPDVQIGIGHVQNPIQNPFAFPSITGGTVAALGDFIDLTVVWDSSVQGPLSWAYTTGAWSPLGFSATGGTGFTWNQNDDVAFYVTLNNATGTSTMHRTNTEPFRLYTSGVYQSPTSASSGASGLKISFTLGAGVQAQANPYGNGCTASNGMIPTLSTMQLPITGTPAFNMDITQAPAGALTYIYLSSGSAQIPMGVGCDLLLDVPGMLLFMNVGLSPLGPVPAGMGGTATHSVAIPNDPALSGLSLYCQGAVIDPTTFLGFVSTNGLQLVFN